MDLFMPIKKLEVELRNKRIIVISDIHGNLSLFKDLLAEVHYSTNDILILAGDLIDKGNASLDCVRFVMSLCNVYPLMGNCDDIAYLIKNYQKPDYLKRYALFRKKSLINELANLSGIEINDATDMHHVCELINQNFNQEISFLSNLPHLLESEDFIFTHSGFSSDAYLSGNAFDIIATQMFMDCKDYYDKYMIVGHMPTSGYCDKVYNNNPLFDFERKKISIDGGNCVKAFDQLNALIIEYQNDIPVFSHKSVDGFIKAEVKLQQIASLHPCSARFLEPLEIIEESEDSYLAKTKRTDVPAFVHKKNCYTRDGVIYGQWTNYFLELNSGDEVSILDIFDDLVLVKKAGIIGWCKKTNLE